MISHSSPDLGESEIEAATLCLRSQQVVGGLRVRELETRIARDLGYAGAVATSSCTQAMNLALRARFDGAPVSVGLPSYVCRSVYDAVCMAGAQPQLLDIDFRHFSVDPYAPRLKDVKAVIVPHMFGVRAPIEKYLEAGLWVIEDNAQRLAPLSAAGREPKAQVRVLSFEATKFITGGAGGLLLSDDYELVEKARKLRDAPYTLTQPAGSAPLTDIQAAIILAQWERLPGFLSRRRAIADQYLAAFAKDHAECIDPSMRATDTYHFRFLLRVPNPEPFMASTANEGVITRRPVAPVPLHKLFSVAGNFTATEDVWSKLVSIPIYPRLSDDQAATVIRAVTKALPKSPTGMKTR